MEHVEHVEHVEHMGRSTAAPESGTGIPGFRIAPVAAG